MENNEFFIKMDTVINLLEILILFLIGVMSTLKLKELVFGGKEPKVSTKVNIETSYFLTALTVVIFHYTGSSIAQYIYKLSMDKMEKRQVFYFMMFFMEFVFIVTLFALHKIRSCPFTRVSRYVCYLSVLMALLQMMVFVSRGMLDVEALTPVYRYSVVTVNLVTLGLISSYPAFMIVNMRKHQKNYN